MKIQNLSIIAGSEACNARCPFCISGMTPTGNLESGKEPKVNWRNFHIAGRFCESQGVTTAKITGKGEPTLFPKQITEYLNHLSAHNIPFLELQTNGLNFAKETHDKYLKKWYDLNLSMICISIADVDRDKNISIYTPSGNYMDLSETLKKVHDHGYSTRLNITMAKGYVSNFEDIMRVRDFAHENGVTQTTFIPVARPDESRNPTIYDWVKEHELDPGAVDTLRDTLDEKGTRLMNLVHGGVVYDVDGQNICLADCLTIDPKQETIRQLIFFPDGKLCYDWQYEGARLL